MRCYVFFSVATPSVAPVLSINSNDLPAVPPSAIVPQRAHIGRPPRIPRSESATQQKKNPSPITEQQEEVVLAQEIRVSSKRRVKTKQEIIEDHVEVIIEQQHEILPDIIKEVQSTPLRGRKKKVVQEDVQPIPQLEPPPPPAPATPVPEPENEVIPKKTRGGRSKKKEEQEEVKPTRTASARGRKKQEEPEEVPAPLPKKPTRGKKLIEPIVNTEEVTEAQWCILNKPISFRFHQRKFVLHHHVVRRNHQWKTPNRLFRRHQRKARQHGQRNEKEMKIPMRMQWNPFKYDAHVLIINLLRYSYSSLRLQNVVVVVIPNRKILLLWKWLLHYR